MADNQNATAETAADRKRLAADKADFDLHVLLIMRTDGYTKSKAVVTAYREGKPGLKVRLEK